MFLAEPLFSANGPAPTHSIVLAEYQMAAIDFLIRMLEIATSYPVIHTSTSFQALQAVRTCRPRLLLLDDELPDRTGYEFCVQLRASNELARIPIILFTATDLTLDMPGCPLAPLRKPFGLPELFETVQELLRRRETLPQGG